MLPATRARPVTRRGRVFLARMTHASVRVRIHTPLCTACVDGALLPTASVRVCLPRSSTFFPPGWRIASSRRAVYRVPCVWWVLFGCAVCVGVQPASWPYADPMLTLPMLTLC